MAVPIFNYLLFFRLLSSTFLSQWTFFTAFVYIAVIALTDVKPFNQPVADVIFLSGFLAQIVQGGALEDCIRSANYAANYIIQQSGCQLPDKPNFSRDSVGF
jgi:pfkB family carbohydrate kinase